MHQHMIEEERASRCHSAKTVLTSSNEASQCAKLWMEYKKLERETSEIHRVHAQRVTLLKDDSVAAPLLMRDRKVNGASPKVEQTSPPPLTNIQQNRQKKQKRTLASKHSLVKTRNTTTTAPDADAAFCTNNHPVVPTEEDEFLNNNGTPTEAYLTDD
jgi:hypothetical protein